METAQVAYLAVLSRAGRHTEPDQQMALGRPAVALTPTLNRNSRL